MTALRTTGPSTPESTRLSPRVWMVGVIAFGVFGCGSAAPTANEPDQTAVPLGINDPAWLTTREKLPSPDPDRIEYDSDKRILKFYDLSGQDRWMVQLPGELRGQTVGPLHRLPEGVDTKNTLVYYIRPGVKVSIPLTVATIAAVRGPHASEQATNNP
jgi:cholesterol transport system auxiliary component